METQRQIKKPTPNTAKIQQTLEKAKIYKKKIFEEIKNGTELNINLVKIYLIATLPS